jgi:hypothetical protein
MKAFLSILIILFLSSFKKETATIREWTRYTLDFADFKASADKKSNLDAYTDCGIKYEMYVEDDSAYIRVVAVLNRHKSWIKAKTPEVLQHEQGHFNICERSVRMFRKKIQDNAGQLSLKNIDSEMTKMLAQASESNQLNQNMYEHSLDDQRVQSYWDKLIEGDIDKLENYSSSLIIISLKH